jgi:hypothetical protein
MALDVAVLGDDYRYLKHIHIDNIIKGVLFKKMVTEKDYPSLGKARHDDEDITFTPENIPSLVADLQKLESYLKTSAPMSDDVKGRCLKFTKDMLDICTTALDNNKNVEFVAGE